MHAPPSANAEGCVQLAKQAEKDAKKQKAAEASAKAAKEGGAESKKAAAKREAEAKKVREPLAKSACPHACMCTALHGDTRRLKQPCQAWGVGWACKACSGKIAPMT